MARYQMITPAGQSLPPLCLHPHIGPRSREGGKSCLGRGSESEISCESESSANNTLTTILVIHRSLPKITQRMTQKPLAQCHCPTHQDRTKPAERSHGSHNPCPHHTSAPQLTVHVFKHGFGIARFFKRDQKHGFLFKLSQFLDTVHFLKTL